MNAPLIWIVAPGLIAIVFLILNRHRVALLISGVLLCIFLALLAWAIRFDETIRLGAYSFEIKSFLELFGRRLVLQNGDRPVLVAAYLFGAFWLGGSSAAGGGKLVVPLGLGIIPILVASLAVEPFLYAGLMIETAVLLSIPLLTPIHQPSNQGVIRYLIFQSLGMPFILLSGWAATGVEINPGNLALLAQAVVLLSLGFAFWLAVFPFYSWVPLLAGQSHPYPVGFVFMMLPSFILLLLIGFLDQFTWLRSTSGLLEILRLVGVVMIVTAGSWGAFQRNIGRLVGYGVIIEIGFSLLAVSLVNRLGLEAFSMMFLPRLLVLGLLALSLSIFLMKYGSLDMDVLEGAGRRLPFASIGMSVGILSMAGIPLSATFSPRYLVLQGLAATSLPETVVVLVGLAGILFSGLRILSVVLRSSETHWRVEESWTQILLLGLGLVLILILGLAPSLILPWMTNILTAFPRLR